MSDLLLKTFVKDYKHTEDPKVRYRYGILAVTLGMLCNLFLFILKLIIGLVMNASAIVSDAFNNLSDCITNIVSLYGYHAARKPADAEHPFGHGRVEYIVSFVASLAILVVGYELLVSSIQEIRHPGALSFNPVLTVILMASIAVKAWMAHFYQKLGKASDSLILLTASQDSKADILTTSVTVVSVFLSRAVKNFPLDGVVSFAVSLLILKSGIELSRRIINQLLGLPVGSDLYAKLESIIREDKRILGVHDMIVHDYGPDRKIGSAHIELDSSLSFVEAHEAADEAERRIRKKTGTAMSLHMDPIDIDNPVLSRYRVKLEEVLKMVNPDLTMHDLQMDRDGMNTVLSFDVKVPFDCRDSDEEMRRAIDMMMEEKHLKLVITFDRGYTEGM
jgi:cation diffusion facilitator family transporter